MSRRLSAVAALVLALPLLASAPAPAELKAHTLEAFQRYTGATEARFLADVSPPGPFLYVDRLTGKDHEEAFEDLQRGKVFIERLQTRSENDAEIKVEDGLFHHWVGTVFIPGVSLEETLDLVQDYGRHAEIYAPQVEESRVIDRSGDNFKVFYRLRKKKIFTVVHNTDHDVRYFRQGADRAYSISEATRIQEVDNVGDDDEREKPAGDDSGFLWAINSYWKFLERDGGVYVECESVSLTRGIPFFLSWMIKPFVNSVPRELLEFTLSMTREAMVGPVDSDDTEQ
jgi:hypothetical protein